jgi:Zn-finger nucleic acid-binding protein
MADRQNIEIDYCPQCRGVWLDRGELDKIIERAASASVAEAAPPPRQPASTPSHSDHSFGHRHDKDDRYKDDRYRQGYPHKKRKGFLGELFDFD